MLSRSRLVASTRSCGQARSSVSASSAQAPTTCSQLSRISSARRPASAAARISRGGRDASSGRPSADATACATRAPSTTLASSTNQTPSGQSPRSCPPAVRASRVLPTPPVPVSVTTRWAPSSRTMSRSSRSRPIRLVTGRGSATGGPVGRSAGGDRGLRGCGRPLGGQTVLVDAIPKLAAAEPEAGRGPGDVPPRVAQDLRDPGGLDLARDVHLRQLRLSPSRRSGAAGCRSRCGCRRKLEGRPRQLGRIGEEHGAGDDVLQLADVPGPRVRAQSGPGLRGQRLRGQPRSGTRLAQEPLAERKDVVRALAEGRQVDGDHRQAMVEVRPEATLAGGRLQILAGGRDDPHVDRLAARRPQAPHRALLEDLQELGLGLRRQEPDLVEEQSPAVCLLQEPGLGSPARP